MLKSLTINNVAVIESADPCFENGLNILTGETGAGKSIIIDSINAILGERTSKELIRTGCEKATVAAVFEDVSKLCKKEFAKYDIPCEDGVYIFQRTLSHGGKNVCRINGIPVNTSVLKEVGKHLVNIHGQHDNQMLLKPENHCMFLDAFAENESLRTDYKSSFDKFKQVRKKLNVCVAAHKQQSERLELLKYQINELQTAQLKEGETEELKNKISLLEKSEKLNEILAPLVETEGEYLNPVEKLGDISGSILRLGKLSGDLSEVSDRLSAAVIELQDISALAENALASLNFDPNELENLQNRLDFLYGLMRKYNVDEQGLFKTLENLQDELEDFNINSENLAEYEQELLKLQNELIEKAAALSASRKKACERLSEKICSVLAFLDMGGVKFSVDIKEGSYTSEGIDRVEFLIATNKGQQLMPLAKIASGGELSRIMLAIKSVLADKDTVDTLIFDEIDTGISGRAARKIGIQLSRVSKARQVICITHLAQIAALADCHLLISKTTEKDAAYTTVTVLNNEQHINEVARIMSGGDMTDNLYQTAKELIDSQRQACLEDN